MVKERFKTPSEILENYPQIRKIWDARKIGYLFYLQLVEGRKMPRGCLVSEKQVVEIYKQFICNIDKS